ncbi:hypothetical protein F0562_022215 [Nyssa sinensis]|uniref:Retrotransposon Copia-like N-terminal domain-containing protein n=1 Tax=Nyssa sinensis TaxID=561372 RepID=A0A5J5BMN7_9ASTE|nr:hypothetical protein F0562_022215 [Nyssa sinensis]
MAEEPISVTPQNPSLTHNSIDDSYFLHHGENPGLMLVSQQLNGDNYPTWARAMSKAFSAKNKLGFVNGTLTKLTNPSDPLYSAWERCNDMVLSWILNSVMKNIASSILYIDVAADAWKDLKERFSQGNRPRIFQLKKVLNSLTQDQMTILLLDSLPSMNRVFALIVQDEKQREIKVNSVPSFDSIAAVTTITRNSYVTTKNGNKQSGFRRDRPVCSHFGYTGHTSNKCYRIHGFPLGFKSKKANVHSANQVTSSPTDQVRNELPQLAFTQEQHQQILALINPPTKFLHSANQVSTASPLPSLSSSILPTPNIQYSENLLDIDPFLVLPNPISEMPTSTPYDNMLSTDSLSFESTTSDSNNHPSHSPSSPPPPLLRQSTKQRKQPSYLQDYHCQLVLTENNQALHSQQSDFMAESPQAEQGSSVTNKQDVHANYNYCVYNSDIAESSRACAILLFTTC